MRKCLALVILTGALFSSLSAHAQTPIRLSSLQVQLWPEYDQPSMLVIYDLKLPDDTKLPISITLRLPKDANLVAVASQAADGSLLNADYQGPTMGDSWQTISLQIPTAAIYHIEYYEPLSKAGDERHFSYVWAGDYAVDDLAMSVRMPLDATNVSSDPSMEASQGPDGTPYLRKDFGAVAAEPAGTAAAHIHKNVGQSHCIPAGSSTIPTAWRRHPGSGNAQQLLAVYRGHARPGPDHRRLRVLLAVQPWTGAGPRKTSPPPLGAGGSTRQRGVLPSVRHTRPSGRSILPRLRDQAQAARVTS